MSYLTTNTIISNIQTVNPGAFVPSGIVFPFAGFTTPTGYLFCDGSSYPTATYPNLFAAIGYNYGGAGANFNVPDLRYNFLRGSPVATPQITGSGSFASNQATFTSHGYVTGDQIKVLTTLATGLTVDQDYFVIRVNANELAFASSYANALAGTRATVTGSAVGTTLNKYNLWAVGSGTADSLNRTATFTNHGFKRTGLRVRLLGGTLSGLASSTNYFAIVVDANTLAFASSYANAMSGTRIAISGANTAAIAQWEDPDSGSRGASGIPGFTVFTGTRQADQNLSHTHTLNSIYNTTLGLNAQSGGGAFPSGINVASPQSGASGGTQANPINVYMNFIIKV